MHENRVYETARLKQAEESIRSEKFRTLLAGMDGELSALVDSRYNENYSDYQVAKIIDLYDLGFIWYLASTSAFDTFFSDIKHSCQITLLLLINKCLAIATFTGRKPDVAKFDIKPNKRNRWDPIPSIQGSSLTVIPLSSISDLSGTTVDRQTKRHDAFATSRTVARQPDYLGAALVGGAVGGNLGAVAAMSYESTRTTQTISYYSAPSVDVKETGEFSFIVDGPATIRETDQPYLTVKALKGSLPTRYSVTVRVPRQNKKELANSKEDTGYYNTLIEKLARKDIRSSLDGIAKKAASEAQISTAYARRKEWFGIGVEPHIKASKDRLAVMYGEDIEAAFGAIQSDLIKGIDAELKLLAEKQSQCEKTIKRAEFKAKLFNKAGDKSIESARRSLSEVKTKIATLTSNRNRITSASS